MEPIKLSKQTLDLAAKLRNQLPLTQEELSLTAFLKWHRKHKEDEDRLLMARLHAALFADFTKAFSGKALEKAEKPRKINLLLLSVVALCATVLVAADGYFAMFTLLSLFAIANPIVIAAGIAFALVAVTFFYTTRLPDISENLGVQVGKASQLVDSYIEQMSTIDALYQTLLAKSTTLESKKDVEEMIALSQLLREQAREIKCAKQTIEARKSHSKLLPVVKLMASGAGATLFFCAGFFTGQMILAAALGGPVLLAVAALFGIAAVVVYCFEERVVLASFFSKLFGIDDQKLKALDNITALEEKLDDLTTALQNQGQKLDAQEKTQQQLLDQQEAQRIEKDVLQNKAEDLQARETSLKDRETALQARESTLEKKEKNLQNKEEQFAQREGNLLELVINKLEEVVAPMPGELAQEAKQTPQTIPSAASNTNSFFHSSQEKDTTQPTPSLKSNGNAS